MALKSVVNVAIAALLGCSLAGCGSSSGGGTKDAASKKVVVWIRADDNAKLTTDYLSSWAKQNGVTVDVQEMAQPTYQQNLQLGLKTGKGPDVFFVGGGPKLMRAGLMANLDNIIDPATKSALGDALKPPANYIYNGHIYAVPTITNPTRLVYNKTIFQQAGLAPDKPPATLGDVLADCAQIAKVKGAYCYGLPLKQMGFTQFFMDNVLVAGNPQLSGDGMFVRNSFSYDMSLYAPVVDAYHKIVKNNWDYPGASTLDHPALVTAFAQGKLGMYMAQSGDVQTIDKNLKSGIEWGVGNNPTVTGQAFADNVALAGIQFGLAERSENSVAAKKVLNALISENFEKVLAKNGQFAIMPAANAVVDKSDPHVAAFAPDSTDALGHNSPSADLAIKGTSYDAALIKLVLQGGDVNKTLSDLTTQYNAALQAGLKSGSVIRSNYA